MKTSETAEEQAKSVHETPELRKTRQSPDADPADPDGVDGSNELAVAVGESACGILASVGISGAADDRLAGDLEEGERDRAGGAGGEESSGGAGSIRQLSRNEMTAQIWIAILVGVAAIIDDLRRRRIANWIPVAALAGGFGWQIGQHGAWGAVQAISGTAAGFAVFLTFYLLGGMGGGDVKLMAGFGALLGWPGILWAALWTAFIGGVLAVAALAGKAAWRGIRGRNRGNGEKESIPYAPAIALGVWLALVPKG
jgi:prepilin peptidase CpaA